MTHNDVSMPKTFCHIHLHLASEGKKLVEFVNFQMINNKLHEKASEPKERSNNAENAF